MATTPPTLGYGTRGDASIDQVNIWMRSTPWYQSLIRSFGQQPNNVHLSDDQKQQVVRAAQANGVVVDEGSNGQEVDDSGNFEAKGHGLRNTLIVAGVAAAALATMGAAGVFGGAAAGSSAAAGGAAAEGGALASTATVPIVGALAAGGTGLAAGTGAGGATLAGTAAAAGTAGLSYADILKYGVPTAGNLIGGLVQANAAGNASDAQQKYLEEALAYQKEQDTYNRTRQATLDAQDVQRYGDYEGRIAPFIANGTSSNDRMAALLGLPARSGSTGYQGATGGGAPLTGVPVTPDITAKLTDYYASLGLTPTGPGTGPTDIDYMAKQIAATGGLTPDNSKYWLDPSANGRITQELNKAGVKYGASSPPPTPPPASPTTPTTPTAATNSTAASSVQMRAPDGSVKAIPADQVEFYKSKGATVLGAAA